MTDEIWQEVGNGTPSCRKLYVTDGIVGPGAPSSSVSVEPTLQGNGTPDEPLNVVGLNSPADASIAAVGGVQVSCNGQFSAEAVGRIYMALATPRVLLSEGDDLASELRTTDEIYLYQGTDGTRWRQGDSEVQMSQDTISVLGTTCLVTPAVELGLSSGTVVVEASSVLELSAPVFQLQGLPQETEAAGGGVQAVPDSVAGYLRVRIGPTDFLIPFFPMVM